MSADVWSSRQSRASRRREIAAALGLEPNVLAVSAAMFSMGLAEHLWRRFLPKYLEQLGAPVIAIGLFGSSEDFLDGVYQYPGGWIADRYGRRSALLLFISLAAIGYVVYWFAPSWPFVFVGLAFALAWTSMASPTLFAVIGDALPTHKRTMGFTVQSILRRVPIAGAPLLGGLAIARYGVRGGVRAGLVAAIVIALITLGVAARVRIPVLADTTPVGIRDVWRSFPSPLRWLLASDVFIRTCDGLVDVFLVLYAIDVIGIGAPQFGVLIAVQMGTAILAYVPAARLADRTGRKPFVVATFLAFSLFPVAVVSSRSFAWLVGAFVVGGLRELGEPARKAMILDLATPALRARSVGLYYLARSLAVAPAAFIGGLLWRLSPSLPFVLAGAVGLAGMGVFIATVDERYAG
jgi:MFS family permease